MEEQKGTATTVAVEGIAETPVKADTEVLSNGMPSLEEIQKKFLGDKFATVAAGAVITEAGVRHAICEMELTPVHLNARGAVMGGALFTLADFTTAVAAEGYKMELDSVSLDANITYFAPAKGTKIIAEARCIKAGHTTSYYEVQLTDDVGTNVAKFTCNMFTIRKNA